MITVNPKPRKKKSKSISLLALIFLMLTVASCRHKEIYYRFEEITDAKWARDSVFAFIVDSSLYKPNEFYNISLEVTHNTSYPYRNIWLSVSHDLDNDSTIMDEQKEYLLADTDGRWFGAGFGSLYQMSLPFKDHICFKERRNYTFLVKQSLPDDPLMGIEKIGLKISKEK